jgi:spermidine/putrescine-binding protein
MIVTNSCQTERPTLRLLVWEGYAEPSVIGPFEAAHNCRVTASYIKNSDDLLGRLRTGSYDIISPSSDIATTVARSGLVEHLNLSKISSYMELSPRLLQLPLVRLKGKSVLPFMAAKDRVYGVPFMWGSNTLVYNTTMFRRPPSTWAVLWDPRYQGKVSVWDDLSTVYMAAQLLGYDKPNPDVLYNLTDQQLEVVTNELLALKRNIFRSWSSASDLEDLFENQHVAVAMGWPLITKQLKDRRFPIDEVIPRENTTGWIDYLMIPSNGMHRDLAYKFVDYMIQEQVQKRVGHATGYVPANERAALSADSEATVQAYWEHIDFWQEVPNRRKYIEIWEKARVP